MFITKYSSTSFSFLLKYHHNLCLAAVANVPAQSVHLPECPTQSHLHALTPTRQLLPFHPSVMRYKITRKGLSHAPSSLISACSIPTWSDQSVAAGKGNFPWEQAGVCCDLVIKLYHSGPLGQFLKVKADRRIHFFPWSVWFLYINLISLIFLHQAIWIRMQRKRKLMVQMV